MFSSTIKRCRDEYVYCYQVNRSGFHICIFHSFIPKKVYICIICVVGDRLRRKSINLIGQLLRTGEKSTRDTDKLTLCFNVYVGGFMSKSRWNAKIKWYFMGHLVLQKHIFCLMHWPCSVLLVLQLCTASQHHVCAMELQTLAQSPPTRGTCRAAQTILIASDPSSDWGEVEKRIFECLLSPSFVKSVSINSDNKQPTAATHSLPAPLGTNTNSPPDQMEAAVSKALSSDTVLYKKKQKKTSHTLNLSPPISFFYTL